MSARRKILFNGEPYKAGERMNCICTFPGLLSVFRGNLYVRNNGFPYADRPCIIKVAKSIEVQRGIIKERGWGNGIYRI